MRKLAFSELYEQPVITKTARIGNPFELPVIIEILVSWQLLITLMIEFIRCPTWNYAITPQPNKGSTKQEDNG